LINASAPIGGWNGTPDDDQIGELARSIYQTGLIANALQTQIISRLDDVSSWKSDRVVKNKINQIINEIVDSKDYEKILITLFVLHHGKYFFNFAGSAEPVQFSVDNEYSISGSGNGISMQKVVLHGLEIIRFLLKNTLYMSIV
jgi:hypothetical protein